MERKAISKLNTQVCEEACAWFVEFRAGDVDAITRREFDRWMRKSPEHLAAYLEVAAIWNEDQWLAPTWKWDVARLIAQTTQDPDNVVSLNDDLPQEQLSSSPRRMVEESPWMRLRCHRWAAAVVVVSLLMGTAAWIQFFQAPTYVTTIGEQRRITLSDGSVVELNSRSRIEVRYSAHERDVNLLEG